MTDPSPRSPSVARLRRQDSPASSLRTQRDSLEATELEPTPSVSSLPDRTSVTTGTSAAVTYTQRAWPVRCWKSLGVYWRRHVSRLVSSGEARDHFANERTFLGALRTSLTFAVMGTVITQLMRLQHAPNPHPGLGFYTLGVPLACLCISFAMCIAILGAIRFMHHQDAICRGKALAGGWEIYIIGGMGIVVNIISFILVVSVDISKSIET